MSPYHPIAKSSGPLSYPERSSFFCSIPFAGRSIIIFGGFHFDVLELAFVSVVEAIYALVGSWVLSLLYPDAISPDGVYGHSFWAAAGSFAGGTSLQHGRSGFLMCDCFVSLPPMAKLPGWDYFQPGKPNFSRKSGGWHRPTVLS